MLDVETYRAIAYSSKKGLIILDKVETHWIDWCRQVAYAPWLRDWKQSPLLDQKSCTPRGHLCVAPMSSIALAIFSTTVWGIGIENWLSKPEASTLMMQAIIKLQNVEKQRNYKWDPQIFTEFGKLVPIEIGYLDRWLEQLY